jgi:hypothetical protein
MKDLRRWTRRAAPGPWKRVEGFVRDKEGKVVADCTRAADSSFVAKVNPSVLTQLLDEREKLIELLEAARGMAGDSFFDVSIDLISALAACIDIKTEEVEQ